MTMKLSTETPEVKIGWPGSPALVDNIDAEIRGRRGQEPFQAWLAKRIHNVYPK